MLPPVSQNIVRGRKVGWQYGEQRRWSFVVGRWQERPRSPLVVCQSITRGANSGNESRKNPSFFLGAICRVRSFFSAADYLDSAAILSVRGAGQWHHSSRSEIQNEVRESRPQAARVCLGDALGNCDRRHARSGIRAGAGGNCEYAIHLSRE